MAVNAAAPALIVAALALVGDYSQVSARTQLPASCASRQQCLLNLEQVVSSLTVGWIQVDTDYRDVVAGVLAAGRFDEAHFLRNSELLKAVRQIEESLRTAPVPDHLAPAHLELRRSIAKVRSKLATIEHHYRQYTVIPVEFESALSAAALRALAHHCTERLARLA